MKNLTANLLAVFVFVLCLGNHAWAQGKGNQTASPTNPVFALPANPKPDLVITSFVKTSATFSPVIINGFTPKRSYVVSYRAVVKNQGNAATKLPCELGSPIQSVGGCFDIPMLQPGQSVTINGELKGEVSAAATIISLHLQADMPNCSYSDNPDPSYGEIQESNETNNKSYVIDINIP